MKFMIVAEVSEAVADKVQIITTLSSKLSDYFSDKSYGKDIAKMLVGIICVSPEFEWFSKVRKPKYTSYRKYTNRGGVEIVEDRVFSYDLKIDYETLKNHSDSENMKMLASELIASLSNLDSLPKKVKDFDKENFRTDARTFLENDNCMESVT